MGKRIWIVNYYTGNPDKIFNPRYTQLAHYFMQAGYEVITFNANYEDNERAPLFERKQYGEFDYIHVKAPMYVGNGLKRMYSIWKFAQIIKQHAKEFEHPNVILHNVHAPFDYPIVKVAKELNAKYISEVWDLWPDNFANFGLVSRSNPVMKLFYLVERWIYEHADQLVFTIPGALQYLHDKKWTTKEGGKIDMSRVHYINNGVDIKAFEKDKETWPRKDADLNDPNIVKIVYLGSINRANHVHTLIEAAKILKDLPTYRFFIYGDGTDRELLEKKVADESITNVIFKEKRIPLCEVAWLVSKSTINIMTYQKGFGYMGVSSGKMFQYLAAGRPIICNVRIAYDDVITDNQLGIAQDIDTPEAFAKAIRDLVEQPRASYDAMCERVRKVAERFDYKNLAAEEIKVIEAALAS